VRRGRNLVELEDVAEVLRGLLAIDQAPLLMATRTVPVEHLERCTCDRIGRWRWRLRRCESGRRDDQRCQQSDACSKSPQPPRMFGCPFHDGLKRHVQHSTPLSVAPRSFKVQTKRTNDSRSTRIAREQRATSPQKRKGPSGGTTGRASRIGAWGGWALAPNTAFLGGIGLPRLHWSGQRGKGSTRVRNFLRKVFAEKCLRRSRPYLGASMAREAAPAVTGRAA
jgi:hypothetical protein